MTSRQVAEELQKGHAVTFRPRGNSMSPKIKDGQEVTLIPTPEDYVPRKNDIVWAKVGRSYYLHLIKSVEKERVLIGNSHGGINGWTPKSNIFGLLNG